MTMHVQHFLWNDWMLFQNSPSKVVLIFLYIFHDLLKLKQSEFSQSLSALAINSLDKDVSLEY